MYMAGYCCVCVSFSLYHPHGVHLCGLLVATHVACSVVCASVCLIVCRALGLAVQNGLIDLSYRLGGQTYGPKEPCNRWGS